MIRYFVLILLIIFGIFIIANIFANKIIKSFLKNNISDRRRSKKPDEVLFNKDDIIVLRGEAKERDNNEK